MEWRDGLAGNGNGDGNSHSQHWEILGPAGQAECGQINGMGRMECPKMEL